MTHLLFPLLSPTLESYQSPAFMTYGEVPEKEDAKRPPNPACESSSCFRGGGCSRGKCRVHSHNCPLVHAEIQAGKKNYNSYCRNGAFNNSPEIIFTVENVQET